MSPARILIVPSGLGPLYGIHLIATDAWHDTTEMKGRKSHQIYGMEKQVLQHQDMEKITPDLC